MSSRKNVLGFLFAAAVVAGALAPAIAFAQAPSRDTVTVTCTSGFSITVDAHAQTGSETAIAQYNANNPVGDFCTVD